jgi:hypothetical protein
MTFEVNFDIIDENDNEKYNGYVTINMTHVNVPKIKWVISDCGCYPSSDWIALLNYMKGSSSKCPNIGGGGNSGWGISIKESSVIMEFEISGNGGDSTIELSFSFQEMIPIVEEIIVNIKKME